MSKRQAQTASKAVSVATLQAELAEVESELTAALALQDAANQASIWQFNTLGATDAFIARSEHDKRIKRLEQLSLDADTIKAEADALVRRLRDRKRELTQKLGSRVNDKQMSAEREQVEKSASENAEAQVKAQSSQAKATAKQKTKTELIAETKKQAASKKKTA